MMEPIIFLCIVSAGWVFVEFHFWKHLTLKEK